MTFPPLVPAPVRVDVDATGAPLLLSSGFRLAGDAATGDLARERIRARTGLIETAGAAHPVVELTIADGAPESYTIHVDSHGAQLVGADSAGLAHATATLTQLLIESDAGWMLPAVDIEDAPRFAYRGVMLDVARHFHPVETVFAYIDGAAALKFSHLHLHLTDDQGWRLELARRPELTALASDSAIGGANGGYYSREDYARIVACAARQHMTVVPEIDVPGHTHAVGLAYPELAADPVISTTVAEDAATFGGGLPVPGQPYTGFAVGFSSLRINDDATYAFLTDVFGELAEMTPGPYIHLGGDECLGTDPADYARFIARASDIVRATGKTPIAWHEAGSAAGIDASTIGQYWGYVVPQEGADDRARAFVERGAQLILSPADAAYLDMKPTDDFPLGLTWARGATSLADSYDWDPAAIIDGVGDAEILGVEAPLWTETVVTLADIHALVYPRIAAIAEIAWSPRVHDERQWDSFRQRVAALAPGWDAAGIPFWRSNEVDWR